MATQTIYSATKMDTGEQVLFYVSQHKNDACYPFLVEQEPCKECDGQGYIDDFECPECRGKGYKYINEGGCIDFPISNVKFYEWN